MIVNEETRNIKLTLSARCYSRLRTDSAFVDISTSRLIEIIICEYCEWSAKIYAAAEKNRLTKMFNILAEGGEIRFFKSIAGLLMKTGDDEIRNRHSFASSKSYNWTVTQAARQALNGDELSDREGTNFITDILEEYTDMNYSVREKILLRDSVKTIEKAIKSCYVIKYMTRNGRQHSMVPYRIIADTDTQYNYLVGIPLDADGKESGVPGCARVFSMYDISIIREKHHLNPAEIERYIEGRDIAYLWGSERDDIRVALTPNGESTLKLLIHNRPVIVGTDGTDEHGNSIYIIRSTEYQAKIYFQSFGREARILYPETLVNNMIAFHEDALNLYKTASF